MTETEFIKWLELGLFGGFVALLSWTGARVHKRLDALESSKASKRDLEVAIASASTQREEMLSAMAEHRDETRNSFAAQSTTLTQILLRLPK